MGHESDVHQNLHSDVLYANLQSPVFPRSRTNYHGPRCALGSQRHPVWLPPLQAFCLQLEPDHTGWLVQKPNSIIHPYRRIEYHYGCHGPVSPYTNGVETANSSSQQNCSHWHIWTWLLVRVHQSHMSFITYMLEQSPLTASSLPSHLAFALSVSFV